MQYKTVPSLAFQHQSQCQRKHLPFEKANRNSLAKQALQCFVKMFFQFLGHLFSQMSQAVFYWALWIGGTEHWGSVTVKSCSGKCWQKKVYKIKQYITSTVSDFLSHQLTQLTWGTKKSQLYSHSMLWTNSSKTSTVQIYSGSDTSHRWLWATLPLQLLFHNCILTNKIAECVTILNFKLISTLMKQQDSLFHGKICPRMDISAAVLKYHFLK